MNNKENPEVTVECGHKSCANCVYGQDGLCEVTELNVKYGDEQ